LWALSTPTTPRIRNQSWSRRTRSWIFLPTTPSACILRNECLTTSSSK
jgi:hypothetical protein